MLQQQHVEHGASVGWYSKRYPAVPRFEQRPSVLYRMLDVWQRDGASAGVLFRQRFPNQVASATNSPCY